MLQYKTFTENASYKQENFLKNNSIQRTMLLLIDYFISSKL